MNNYVRSERGYARSEAIGLTEGPVHSILTAQEVAEELRCSKAHVYNLLNGDVKGLTVLPHLALGRKRVIPRAAFERWKLDNLTGNISGDSNSNDVDAALKGAMHA